MSVLGGGGSRSTQREPPASRRLLTTFSLWMSTLVRISLSYSGPNPLRINGVWTGVDPEGHSVLYAWRFEPTASPASWDQKLHVLTIALSLPSDFKSKIRHLQQLFACDLDPKQTFFQLINLNNTTWMLRPPAKFRCNWSMISWAIFNKD